MTFESLKNSDFSFHLAFLDGLEGLDDYVFVVDCGDAGVYFGVFSLANFGDDFILVDVSV